jgi:hypothetical protein
MKALASTVSSSRRGSRVQFQKKDVHLSQFVKLPAYPDRADVRSFRNHLPLPPTFIPRAGSQHIRQNSKYAGSWCGVLHAHIHEYCRLRNPTSGPIAVSCRFSI